MGLVLNGSGMSKDEIIKWYNKFRLWESLHGIKVGCFCYHSNCPLCPDNCPSPRLFLVYDDSGMEWPELESNVSRENYCICIEWIKFAK
jgi:hypothetical protein